MTYPTPAEIEHNVWHTKGSAKPDQSAGTTLGDVLDTADRIEEAVKTLSVPGGSIDIDALVTALRPVIAEEVSKALNATKLTNTPNG